MSYRYHYWTSSKFANWVRGSSYPLYAEWDKWEKIHSDAKKAHPLRFWLADTGLDFLEDVVFYLPNKFSALRWYYQNRVTNRVHLLDTKLDPGSWYDSDTRILHGVMEALVFFVEVDCAGHCGGRGREIGLSHIDWEISLVHESDEWEIENDLIGKPTPQSVSASEVKELYLWWKDIRPNRFDPYDDLPPVDDSDKWVTDNWRELERIEQEQLDEDDEMLYRVIKARHGMWT